MTVSKKMEYFQERVTALRAIGCWPMIDKDKSKSEIIYSVCAIASLLNVGIGFMMIIYAIVSFALKHGKMDQEMYDVVMMFILRFQMVSKLAFMWLKASKIRHLVDQLNGYMEENFVVTVEDREIMKSSIKYDTRLSRFILILACMILVASFSKSPVMALRHYLKYKSQTANETYKPLVGELPEKYPFKFYINSLAFWLCYAQQVSAVLPGFLSSWSADSMFCSLLYYLSGHFDILINKIKSDSVEFNDEKILREIPGLVSHHQDLLRYVELIVEAFAPIMVVQMLLGAITIGLVLIHLTYLEGSRLLLIKPIAYLLYKLLQLFVACWHGQLLWNRSEKVGEACYFLPWYQKPRSVCLQYQMIIRRSQKSIKVTAAGLFRFSTSQFTSIIHASYSYFAMMQTIMKQH